MGKSFTRVAPKGTGRGKAIAARVDQRVKAGGITPVNDNFGFWGSPVSMLEYDRPHQGLRRGELFCPGYSGPTYATRSQDKVWFGVGGADGLYTPGIARVSVSKELRVDQQKPNGKNNAKLVPVGIDPPQIVIEISIWTPEQLRRLNDLWAALFFVKVAPAYKEKIEPGPPRTETTLRTKAVANSDNEITLKEQTKTGQLLSSVRGGSGGVTLVTVAETRTIPTYQRKRVIDDQATRKAELTQRTVLVGHPTFFTHRVATLMPLGGDGPSESGQPGVRVFTIHALEFATTTDANEKSATAPRAAAAIGSFLDEGALTPGNDPRNTGP